MTLHELWQRIAATRYTRALETEIARLRAENRALLNSILGIAGVPPLPVIEEQLPNPWPLHASPSVRAAASATRADARHAASGVASHGLSVDARSSLPRQGASIAVPMRRRSWQQINRILEFESAKKKESTEST